MDQMTYPGLYRAVVTGLDPTKAGRLRVSIPRLFGTSSVWAFACTPAPGAIPSVTVGTGVWVMFEGGDINYPVYVGFFAKER